MYSQKSVGIVPLSRSPSLVNDSVSLPTLSRLTLNFDRQYRLNILDLNDVDDDDDDQ